MADSPFSIREARLDDPSAHELIAAVQAYYRSLYGGEDTNPIDVGRFLPPRGRFYIAERDERPVGMIGWHFRTEETPVAGVAAELRRMYVAIEARGLGVGRVLLAQAEADAKAAGAEFMVLETGSLQVEAVTLYRSAGYHDVTPFGWWADASYPVHLAKQLR